tara:strand:+ start:3452 stop:4894 length:1443 start_codon:yes stop_codon:yes gene_type:complete
MAKYNVQVTLGDGEVFTVPVEADSLADARKKALVGQESGARAGNPVLDDNQGTLTRVFREKLPGESVTDYLRARAGLEPKNSSSLSTSDINPDLFDESSSSFSDQYKVTPGSILPAPFNPYIPTGPGDDGRAININPDLNDPNSSSFFTPPVPPAGAAPPNGGKPGISASGFDNDPALQAEIDRLIALGLSNKEASAAAIAAMEKRIADLNNLINNQVGNGGSGGSKEEPFDPLSRDFNEKLLDFGSLEQTDASRQRQLESISPFAAFMEQLEGAGLGGLTGAAGRFAKNQYQPLFNEYTLETLMPLIRGDAAGVGTDQGAYLDALRRSNTTGGYDGVEDPTNRRLLDKEAISQFAPTFGGFVGDRVQGGSQASQLRQLDQLRNLSMMSASQASNPFASGVLNPSDSQEAEMVFSLANQGMAGRYSPLASQAIARYAGSGSEAFADFTRQNLSPVGSKQFDPSQEPENFAKFLGQRYGLF